MPIYEFVCKACGGKFEKLLRFSESTEHIACPHCSSDKTQKRLSMIAVTPNGFGSNGTVSSGGCGSQGGFT